MPHCKTMTCLCIQVWYTDVLCNKDHHAAKLMFQAKVDKSYLDHGMKIQHFIKTQPRVPKDLIEFAVEFIYCDENISWLAWEAKKRTPNRKDKWSKLENCYNVLFQDKGPHGKHILELAPHILSIGSTLFRFPC